MKTKKGKFGTQFARMGHFSDFRGFPLISQLGKTPRLHQKTVFSQKWGLSEFGEGNAPNLEKYTIFTNLLGNLPFFGLLGRVSIIGVLLR